MSTRDSSYRLAALMEIGALEHFIGQFRHLVILVRLNDVTVDFLQVASQSALLPGRFH